MDAILDTSIIIDLFKGDRDLLEKLPKNFIYGISVVILFELHCESLKEREELFLVKMPKISLQESLERLACNIFRSLSETFRSSGLKVEIL